MKTDVTFNYLMSVCKQTPKKNVQLVNCPSENTAIRKYLSRESTERLVHAFITSRLDYCNGLLYGAPEYQIKKLERVMNASAR